jgi:hypothetical protein
VVLLSCICQMSSMQRDGLCNCDTTTRCIKYGDECMLIMAVVNIRSHLHLISRIFRRSGILYKLAEYRVPLRLRCHVPFYYLPAAPRSQKIYHRCICLPSCRKLDPIYWHASSRRHLQRRHGRSDSNGAGTTFCARGTDAV